MLAEPHRAVPLPLVVAVAAALVLAGCDAGAGDPSPGPAATGSPAPSVEQPTELPTFDPSTTVGDYAPGFPLELLAVPEDATVLASSARPTDDGLVDVTLNLASPRSAQQVVDDLAARLTEAGFTESEASAVTGLTAQTAFTRTTEQDAGPQVETLFVGVLDDGERRLATISGSVATAG
ncbi:hypothetical protein [Isoptericola variabilis]|uniref:hypothetical protein n=1 Tax=Isoptericola variabilis TaxID=139208 RepID=UPI00117FC27F|nr:hypothetical protein [Isoptericola variabilis]